MRFQRFIVTSALVSALFWVDAGLGHVAHAGPVEELVELAVHPTDPNVMALRYEYGGEGLVRTSDGGQTWSLMCNSAISPQLTSGGPLAFGADGTLFMAVFSGLWSDDGNGCAWGLDSSFPENTWVRDLVAHPSDPNTLFTITSTGAEGTQNGVYRRVGTGGWEAFGSQEERLITRLHVVDTGDGLRFYESALTQEPRDDGSTNYLIRVSDDDGATWTELPFTFDAPGQLRLDGVDPSNPDRLIASLEQREDVDTIVVSLDGGQTFSHYATFSTFGGVTFADDGRVWLGDGGDSLDPNAPQGLWFADDLASEPTLLTDAYEVKCIHHRDDDSLFVCRRFSAGVLDPDTLTVPAAFEFTKIQTFEQCPGVDMLEACRDQLLGAYCGVTHFPGAPVCEPYGVELPTQGDNTGCAFDFDAGVGTGTLPDGGCLVGPDAGGATAGAGSAGTGSAGMSAMAGMGATTSAGTGPTTAAGTGGPRVADAGTTDEGGNDGSGGSGCGCRLGGDRPSGGATALVSTLLLALALRRRRK